MKKMMVMVLAGASVLLSAHGARDLKLTGSGSPAIWDNGKTATWLCNGETVTFAAGDNVTIDDTFAGTSLMMNARVTPGDIVFDITKTLEFGWGLDWSYVYGLGVDTKSFTKKGSGLLLLRSDLSGQAVNASGGINCGNGLTNGIEIVEGEIALLNRNAHNFLGPRTVPYWVHIHNGASLTFLEGNQTGTYTSPECGCCVQLDEGAKLNHCTNASTSAKNSVLCLNTLRLNGGDFVEGNAYVTDWDELGGTACMKIYETLQFSGSQPHAFGYSATDYPGCKGYSLNTTLAGRPIALNSKAPVKFRVDDITGDDDPDAYIKMNMFTWGLPASGGTKYRSDVVKVGSGTLVFPDNAMPSGKKFYGDFTVKEGEARFLAQGFFPAETEGPAQTLSVSTNAILNLAFRNVVTGTATERPNVKIVVDHGTFKYVTGADAHGCLHAREWVFDDAILDVRNAGFSWQFGVFGFKGPVRFRGTKSVAINPCSDFADTYQSVHVYNNPRTEFDVADLTGSAETDVTIGMKILNTFTSSETSGELKDCGFVKKGAGTLAITHRENYVSGNVTVSEGALRVDGVLTSPASIAIEAGGTLGGTGAVKNVTIAAGAGFFVRSVDNGKVLTIYGDVSLPSSGVVVLDSVQEFSRVKVAQVDGSISGEDFSGWQVKSSDGTVISASDGLMVRDGSIYARCRRGLMMTVR